MIFLTKGEFIQALKDYNKYKEMSEDLQKQYKDLYYLRYEKVRSPLDYDIVGYEGNKAIRQLKGRGGFSQEAITESREKLEEKMQMIVDRNSELLKKINNVNDEMLNFDEPLRSILDCRFRKHMKLKTVCSKFSEMYLDEAGMHKYINRELDKYYE